MQMAQRKRQHEREEASEQEGEDEEYSEEYFEEACQLVMTSKPSALAKEIVERLCYCDNLRVEAE